ncbi:MAG: LamG-like jellyroll fold domain-containing protein, partial [Candidatus Hermodarchaeota archaeon]
LYNFPLLISIFDEDLPNKTQMNGDDIAFAYNGAWLDYEIEVFNQSYNGTHAQFVTWVLIPRLSTLENTIIRMYYGNSTMGSRENPEGVWNSDYNGVWHLKENPTDPAPQFFDSTLNNNDGTADNLTSDNQKPGIIDGSLSIEDNSDINERHINISHSISLQLSTDIMVSSWVKTPTGHNTNTADIILAKWGGIPGSQNYWLGKFSNTEIAYYVNNQTEFVSADLSLINDGYWHHIVGLADANNNSINIYIDGIKVNSSYYSGTSTLGNTDLHIGNSPVVEDQEWIGCIDEVRISNVVHSSDWISTEYNNQYNPQSFLIIGPENNLDIEPPTYTNLTESSDPLELGETEIIIINVSDPSGIHQVKIEFESTNHSMTNIGGDTWQYDSWTPSSVGNYSYTIWMEDNCNNWNFTIGSIEVIDTTPPTYSDLIESADPLQLGQNETITIKVYDSPGSGVNQVLLEYDSFNHTMSLISGKWSWSKWKPNSTGIYPYKIYMEDIENNWNETSGTITVISANAPTIENLTESENPLELGNIITINVDVFDEETNVSTVFIELEGYNYTMTNISGNTYEYNWTRSYVGMVFYTIYANDSDNNWNSFSSSFDIVDTTPPVIENLTVSEAPLELGNIVIITVNSTDLSNINQVWIEFEGTNHSMTNLSGNAWQYTSWSPSSTGNYSYTIWAEDNNNNWGFINSSILVQDNTPPLYSDLTEPPGPVELGNPLVISINATDLADIKEVLIEYEYSNHTMINIGGDIWQYTSWMPGSIGNYTYRIYITDNNDNLNYTSSSILFQDTVLPTYFNLYESADPLELGDNPIFRIDINDFAGINQTLIELEGTNHSMENIYGDRWEFNSWTPDNWIVYQYKIYMQDNSGNWNSLIGNITVQDTIAPPSPVLTVVPSGDVSGILTFDWTEGYDPSGILYFILIIDNETDNVYTFNITNTGPDSSYCELPDILPLGRYYYFLAQIDGTGHQSGYTMGSFTVVSFGNGAPDDNSFVIIIIIILVSIIGSITAMVIVRKKLKKDIIPPREKISFKIISSHIRKLSREELTLQGEEIISKTPGDIQDQTLPIKEVTTEEELERYVNEIRENGEQLFIEGAYLEAQEQFKLGRDFFLRLGREEEAQLFSELITGIDGLIEEREKRIKKLEEVKVQGDSVQIYENFYDIIEISKKLRDIDTVNFYQSELVDYFQHNKLKILNLEIYRYDLNEKAELFVSENKYEIAAQLYGKCEEISQLLVQLH